MQSLSLTHVQYDPLSSGYTEVLAYVTLTPLALLLLYVFLVIQQRSVAVGYALLGQLLNEALNVVLKHTIQQKRPSFLGSGYGMPSSHAQFMAFFAVYAGGYWIYRVHRRFRLFQSFLFIFIQLLSLLVAYSRSVFHTNRLLKTLSYSSYASS